MLLAADFNMVQVVWTLLYIFLFFVWVMLIFTLFGDIIRNDEMSGAKKAIWSVFIIFLPFLGIFGYLIVHGSEMGERQLRAAKAQEAAMNEYIRSAAGTGASAADELAKLADLHAAGKLDDAEYAAAKAKVVS